MQGGEAIRANGWADSCSQTHLSAASRRAPRHTRCGIHGASDASASSVRCSSFVDVLCTADDDVKFFTTSSVHDASPIITISFPDLI